MRKIFVLAIAVALFAANAADAGPIRNLLGRGKAAAGKVLRRASHPFGCANGSCSR